MRKLIWLLGVMLLLLSLAGCGSKVDRESIRSYLENSYYSESDATVNEIIWIFLRSREAMTRNSLCTEDCISAAS